MNGVVCRRALSDIVDDRYKETAKANGSFYVLYNLISIDKCAHGKSVDATSAMNHVRMCVYVHPGVALLWTDRKLLLEITKRTITLDQRTVAASNIKRKWYVKLETIQSSSMTVYIYSSIIWFIRARLLVLQTAENWFIRFQHCIYTSHFYISKLWNVNLYHRDLVSLWVAFDVKLRLSCNIAIVFFVCCILLNFDGRNVLLWLFKNEKNRFYVGLQFFT